jgi:hypothetical protein
VPFGITDDSALIFAIMITTFMRAKIPFERTLFSERRKNGSKWVAEVPFFANQKSGQADSLYLLRKFFQVYGRNKEENGIRR